MLEILEKYLFAFECVALLKTSKIFKFALYKYLKIL